MTDTIPPDIARRIAAEIASIMSKADDDREFREEMLRFAAETRVTMQHMSERMTAHEEHDERRFSNVTQSISGTLSMKHVAMAVTCIVAVSGVIGFVVWIVREVAT